MLLPLPPAQNRVSTVTGTLEILPLVSRVLGNERKIRVWTPPGHRRGDGLLLMHDGQNLFDGATSFIPGQEWRVDETATALIGAGLMPRTVIVGIDNAGADRGGEYLPRAFDYRGTKLGGRADLYLRMISTELLPMLAAKYGTPTKGVGMIGSSLGGIVTLYAGLNDSARYTRLGIVSPSVWIDGRAPLGWVRPLAKRPRAWIDIGGAESDDAPPDARALADRFRKAGWGLKDLAFYEEPRAEHNEGAWARRLPAMLAWLYRK